MDVTLNWKGSLTFEGAADSSHSLQMDTDVSSGGRDTGARPMELIALGLAGCTAMDVVSILEKKRQAITAFQVKVHAELASEHPKVFTRAIIEYLITGNNVDEAAVVRAVELSATKYCQAHAMLSKAFPMELHYQIYDEGSQKLVKKGTWQPAS